MNRTKVKASSKWSDVLKELNRIFQRRVLTWLMKI
jgi:hypothetical protein